MSDWKGWGKLTNLSLFSAQPEEAEEKACGTKAQDKKFTVKGQQKDLPGHISNNGDNGEKNKERVAESRSCTERIQPLLEGLRACGGGGVQGGRPWAECIANV